MMSVIDHGAGRSATAPTDRRGRVIMSSPPITSPRTDPTPRLTRTRDDRVIAGVAGGLGQYLRIDPVIIRVVFVVLALAGGGGLLAYLIAWIVLPEAETDGTSETAPSGSATSVVTGLLLVGLGGFLLLERLLPTVSWRYLGPGLLITLGVILLVRR
jgi:phage shock protein C